MVGQREEKTKFLVNHFNEKCMNVTNFYVKKIGNDLGSGPGFGNITPVKLESRSTTLRKMTKP
jgi:hypothetical protein